MTMKEHGVQVSIVLCVVCILASVLHGVGGMYSLENNDALFEDWKSEVVVRRSYREASPSSSTATMIINETFIDDHDYYTVAYVEHGRGLWRNLDDESVQGEVQAPDILATQARKGKKILLKFNFLFYGHIVTSVVVTTGGFVYAGSHIHKHLAATQYIAPLMGNFSPSEILLNAGVRYYDNGSALTVEWTNQKLTDNVRAGIFTFQATLTEDGRIIFAYKKIPIPLSRISDQAHPVKVGIADAFYIDEDIQPNTKKRDIFEYHQIRPNIARVTEDSAIVMTPLPTCNLFKTCSSCTSGLPTFNCSWCDSISKCSDGQDRHRQVWLANQCDRAENLLVDQLQCPSSSVPTEVSPTEAQTAPPLRASNPPSQTSNSPMQTRSFKQTPSSKQDLVRKSTPSKPGQSPPSTAEMLTTEQLLTTNEATDQYCANIKCLNGGSCVNGFCLCPPRNEGSRCQKYVVKQCKGIHCLNGGTCQEGITLHICDCKRGYSGKYCDVVNSSARSTGSNGATLTVGAIVCIVLIAVLVGGLLVWVVYAYRHPNSSSGLFIIEAKHKIKRQGRGSNGVQCKYHQQVDTNHIDIQL